MDLEDLLAGGLVARILASDRLMDGSVMNSTRGDLLGSSTMKIAQVKRSQEASARASASACIATIQFLIESKRVVFYNYSGTSSVF